MKNGNGFSLYYYDSKINGEPDFVVQDGLSVDLIEIKSCKDFRKHPALNRARKVKNWKFGSFIVFCRENICVENGIFYLPWYMVMFYRQERIPEKLIYKIDLSGLDPKT